MGVDLTCHACVGVAGELLGDAFVHAAFGEHRDVGVAHVMDSTVVDARLAEDAVP